MPTLRPRTLAPLLAFVTLLSLGLALGAPPQQQDEVEIRVEPVGGSVSWLAGQGGNIGLSVGADGVLMIDSQFLRLAPRIEAKIAELSAAKPTWLVNTHWHGDHTGGNPHFNPAAQLVAQANVRRRLAGDAAIGGRVASPVVAEALPEMTFEQGVTLHFNGERVRIVHLPNAHTDGDSIVWFEASKVVHMGDLYFQIGYPFVDVDSGGSILGLIEGVSRVLDMVPEDTKVIPGHGVPTGTAELREYLAMLETITERVRAGLAEGKDADALVAAAITKDYDERWGSFDFVTPEKFVRAVARSLAE